MASPSACFEGFCPRWLGATLTCLSSWLGATILLAGDAWTEEPLRCLAKANGTGKVTYRVGWRKARRYAYLYERTYEGAAGHAKPKYSEVCLGAIDKVRAEHAGQEELRMMAFALEREEERRR
jgi:hypothetical protein